MKFFVIFIIFLIFFSSNIAFANTNDYVGRWAEKISERVVMDIYPEHSKKYKIFITWREDNLAQKDFYTFVGKLDNKGKLKYKNGIHFYRYYNLDGSFEEKPDYKDGTGMIKFDNDKLVWLDNKDNTNTEFIKIYEQIPIKDRYNFNKDYFDYSVVLEEFPKDYYYTTVKINKSKERILIITDEVNENKNSYKGLFYYFAKNGFVYPLGLIESKTPFAQSKSYLYYNYGNKDIKFYISDKKLETIKSRANTKEQRNNIEFVTIKSADRFNGDFGSPAGDDIKKVTIDGFYFEYHKGQYKREYINNLMRECIKDGVKTQVQMYCCMVKKLHP